MIILGIDPGTATSGYGLLEIKSTSYEAVSWGLVETSKDKEPEKRLANIYEQMLEIIRENKPDVMVIEKLFFATNAKTAIRVGQAQGAILVAAAESKIGVFEYAPGTIKKVISGSGRADKKMMQQSVRKFLGAKVRSEKKKRTHFDNAADALAVALCHAIREKLIDVERG